MDVATTRRRIAVTPSGHTSGMERQLALIEDRGADYRLDERTREIGRRGVAAAREALRRAQADHDKRGRRPAA